ncbi:MAG: T9SS type A sorting domain-containing protein [Chitinophagaceae bacterium]
MMTRNTFAGIGGLFALLILLLLGTTQNTMAQTWQWGKRGGDKFNGNNPAHDAVIDMATDKNSNVYLVAEIEGGDGTGDIDGHPLAHYGDKDIVVASFTCNGSYRWSKVIGGAGGDSPTSIKTDSIGHVYVVVRASPRTPIYFDTDTTQPATSNKIVSLIQYDTSGNFKWLRQPASDTAGPYSDGLQRGYDLYVAGNGDAYWFTLLTPGLVGGETWVVPQIQPYILKYNAQGAMTDHIALPMQTDGVSFDAVGMTRSKSGKFIISGSHNPYTSTKQLVVGGVTVNHSTVLLCISPLGTLLWQKENVFYSASNRMWSRPQIDNQGNVYYAGDAQKGDIFNGYTFANSYSPNDGSTMPYIAKCDSNGNHLWTTVAGTEATNSRNFLALKNSNEVWMSGVSNSSHWDATHYLESVTNTGTRAYAARFSSTGIILGLDSILGTGSNQFLTYCNAVDPKGNLYIGGEFGDNLHVGPDNLNNVGGTTDFFVAKFGYPCYCTTQPTASFNSVATGKTLKFTYTGTTTNIDSVVWSWGDGQQQTVKSGYTTPLSHTYTGGGSYTACANVYGSCGSSSYCKQTALGVSGISAFKDVSIYPNPATTYFTVEGASGATISLSNAVGQVVKNFSLTTDKEVLDISDLAAGVYVLQLTDKEGNRGVMQLLKE